MKEVLQRKIESLIYQNRERNINELIRMNQMTNEIEDYLVPSKMITFHANGKIYVATDTKSESTLHRNAMTQLCARFGIPISYIETLNSTAWGRLLIQTIFTDHNINTTREKYLFRYVGDEIRGILSANYKRYDSNRIYQEFLQIARAWEAQVIDCHTSDTRTFIEILNPKIYELQTPNNGTIYRAFGARLQNSDFGNGAYSVSLYEYNPICSNGAVTQRLIKKIHKGGEIPDNIELSEATIKLQTDLQISLIRDFGKFIFTGKFMEERMDILNKASNTTIDLDKECSEKLPKMGVTKGEVDLIRKAFIDSNPENGIQGPATLLKLLESMTAIARDIEDGERKRELESIAGTKLLGRLATKAQKELLLDIEEE